MFGRAGAGIRFEMGGIVRRYATMAVRSDGVRLAYDGQGIGNGSIRLPSCRIPFVRTALI